MRLTLPLSAGAHLGLIALLLLLPETVTAPPKVDLSKAIAVVFAPPPPEPPPPAPAQPEPEPPPPPVVEQPPPAPEPPPPQVVEQPPPPPAPVAETPPPPPPKREPKPVPKPRPRPQPVQQAEQPAPQLPLPMPMPSQAPPQMASIPTPPPAATISPDYRTLLSGWLESHKRYPEEARQRGEEGRAILRFRVDRFGRVLSYSVVSSTGFADLDAAVDAMMRGATLPPFPPSMREPEIEVSVTIRFGLSR